jgi:hypothetical protein
MPLQNTKHESFALGRASGKSSVQSYREAGYAGDKSGANAGKLTRNDQISARVDWLKTQTAASAVMTQVRKRELLAAIAENPEARDVDRINAIKADNELSGEGATGPWSLQQMPPCNCYPRPLVSPASSKPQNSKPASKLSKELSPRRSPDNKNAHENHHVYSSLKLPSACGPWSSPSAGRIMQSSTGSPQRHPTEITL